MRHKVADMTKIGNLVNKFSNFRKVLDASLELRMEGTTLQTNTTSFIYHKK
jgi:hypothetical protein